jgi:hypothetical protein
VEFEVPRLNAWIAPPDMPNSSDTSGTGAATTAGAAPSSSSVARVKVALKSTSTNGLPVEGPSRVSSHCFQRSTAVPVAGEKAFAHNVKLTNTRCRKRFIVLSG